MFWKTSRREFSLDRALIMAILNVTPDSFSDGGRFLTVDEALAHAERLIEDGADILDIGGESTRPGSSRVSAEEELRRVLPVIEGVSKRFNIPISVDTTKSEVAERAVEAGAEIINDISGLRFDVALAAIAARHQTGLILMHSFGDFESMHFRNADREIMREVREGLRDSIGQARAAGVSPENIVLDVGIGFGKTIDQNLELLAKLDEIVRQFPEYPMLIGTSRKSFLGKLGRDVPPKDRSVGSLATAAVAIWNGANIVRVHDPEPTSEMVKTVKEILRFRNENAH